MRVPCRIANQIPIQKIHNLHHSFTVIRVLDNMRFATLNAARRASKIDHTNVLVLLLDVAV